jgi:hypothetical protein
MAESEFCGLTVEPSLASIVHDWHEFYGLVGPRRQRLWGLYSPPPRSVPRFQRHPAGADVGIFDAHCGAFPLGAFHLHPDSHANPKVGFARHRARLPWLAGVTYALRHWIRVSGRCVPGWISFYVFIASICWW